MKMIKFIKQILCKHEMQVFNSNVYGDAINILNCRSLWTCAKCGKYFRRQYLVKE